MYLFQVPNTLNTQWLVCVCVCVQAHIPEKLVQAAAKIFSKNDKIKRFFVWNQAHLCPIFKLLIEWAKAFISHRDAFVPAFSAQLEELLFPHSFSPPKQREKQSVLISAALQTWNKIDPRKEWAVAPVPAFDPNLALLNRPGLTEPTQSNWLSVEQSTLSCWCQVKRCLCYSALASRPLVVRLTRALCVCARPHWRLRRGWCKCILLSVRLCSCLWFWAS